MGITRPAGEQLRFRSRATGDHILDAYMEASEKGGRPLYDLLDDLFQSETGKFNPEIFQFRYDPSSQSLQVRVGQFANSSSGWTTITGLFTPRGEFSSGEVYGNFDLVITGDKDVYAVTGLASPTQFSDEQSFVESEYTERLIDVSEARDWAKKTDGQVDGTDYSAKAYAVGGQGIDNTIGSAKDWAIKTDATVDGTNYSAKYWATHPDVVTVSTDIQGANTIGTVSSDIANVSVVATDIGNVNVAATNISDIKTAASNVGSGNDITVTATNIADINTTAASIASVNTAAADITNINTSATNITGINTVANDIENVNLVAANIGVEKAVTIVAAEISGTNHLQEVADNATNINTVASDISDVNALGPISDEIQTLADIQDGTVATGAITGLYDNLDSIQPLGANVAELVTTAQSIGNVNIVAESINAVETIVLYATDVSVVSADIDSVATVASDLNEPESDIQAVSAAIPQVNVVGSNISSVVDLAAPESLGNINAVGPNIDDVVSLSAIIQDIQTLAATQDGTVAQNAITDLHDNVEYLEPVGQNISHVIVTSENIQAIIDAHDNAEDALKYAYTPPNTSFTDSRGETAFSARHYASVASQVGSAFTHIVGDERVSGDTDDITSSSASDSLTFLGVGGAKVQTDQAQNTVFMDSRSVAMAIALG